MTYFIPIKENSQRVPRKNFRPLGDKPLYKHIIDKLKGENVFVDTDSVEIIKELRTYSNVIAYERSEKLIGDNVSVCDLIYDFLNRFEDMITYNICQLHVTSPLIPKGLLDTAFEKMNQGYDSVVSCNKVNTRFWRKEKYGYCPVNHNPNVLQQTQDLPTYYEENSNFYIFKAEEFMKTKSRIGTNPYFFPTSFPYNMDIDTEDDWKLLEQVYKWV